VIDLAQHAIDAGVWLIAFEEIERIATQDADERSSDGRRAAPSGATVDHDAAKLTELGQHKVPDLLRIVYGKQPVWFVALHGKIDIKEGQSKDAQAVKGLRHARAIGRTGRD